MKKKYILLSGIMGLSLILPISYNISSYYKGNPTKLVSADEVTEAEYEVVDIADLTSPYANNGSVFDKTTNGFSKIIINSAAAYFSTHKNVEYTGIINSSAAWVGFSSRTMTTTTDFNRSSGYFLRYYFTGRVDLYKNGAKLVGNVADLVSTAPAKGEDHVFSFKTVDLSDGTVKISLSMDDKLLYTYTDTTDPITTGGGFFVRADSGTTYIKPSVTRTTNDIFSMSEPITSANFKASSVNEDSVLLTGGGAGYAGAIFETQTYGKEFGYKVQVTPTKITKTTSSFVFSIGGSKHAKNSYQRPNLSQYWDETGYQFTWNQTGSVTLARNGKTLKSFGTVAESYSNNLNNAYDIELSFKQYEQGNSVLFKVNDKYVASYFDLKTDENTPIKLSSTKGGAPSSKTFSNGVWSVDYTEARIDAYSQDLYETKTVVSKDLGNPTTISNSATFSKNGEPVSFDPGPAFGYNAKTNNARYQFNMNLSKVGTELVFMTNYKGSLDTPSGPGWTSKGYAIYLKNGQIILIKNGVTLMEGWTSNSYSLTKDTKYLVTIDSYMIDEDSRRIRVKLNSTDIINYIDSDNPINQEGWFACYSTGTSGSITQVGYELPVVTTTEQSIFVNGTTTLSYENPIEGDEVSYYIDEKNSTATGTITGNILTATSVGDLYVYACVNGIYSESICVEVNSLSDLVNKYYNDGVYTKKTNINLSGDAETELKQYFHGRVDLDRTTYYKGNALLMGDITGGFDHINSGYGTDENGNMTHFRWNQELEQIDINYTVLKGQHENWKDKDVDGMEGFYVTLNDMLEEGYFDNWTGNRHSVSLTEDSYIGDFLAFAAPCLYETIIDTKYITVSELVISEETHDLYGNYLCLRIILDSTSRGLVDNEELILAEARIYKGNVQFDESQGQ